MRDGDASLEGEDHADVHGCGAWGLDQSEALRELRLVIARQPLSVRAAVEEHLNLPQFTDLSGAHVPAAAPQGEIISSPE